MPRIPRLVLVVVVLASACSAPAEVSGDLAVATATALPAQDPTATPTQTATATPPPVQQRPVVPEELAAYAGLGAWVDVFDWAPPYAGPDGPVITSVDFVEMAALGVTTIYLQTSRLDDVGSGLIESPEVIVELLTAAHAEGMEVVGWYLPRWEDAAEDLARLVAIAEFSVDGQQFDGVAVDIEGVPATNQRADWNRRLVELSSDLRQAVDPLPVGAIVLPPTILEVVNIDYWPDFPWAEIAPHYDVWLPMSYWSFRSSDSPFANGYSYNADATERLRRNIGDPNAIVHGIGGIGAVVGADELLSAEPLADVAELDDFVRSLVDTAAIGGSIYDWASMDPAARQAMTTAMQAADLLVE